MSRRALIVGIDGYKKKPLDGCVRDAEEMFRVLNSHEEREGEENGDHNFDCHKYIVPNPPDDEKESAESQNSTEEEKQKKLDAAFLKARIHKLFSNKADLALFYFSGHGENTPFGGYLVTEGARKFEEGVPMSDLLVMANQSLANEVIIILDCCFSGQLGNQGFSNLTSIREGVTIITSSSDYQKSYEQGGMGVFTRRIVQGLSGEASDVLGRVNVGALYSFTEKMFNSWQQRPIFKSHLNSMTTIRQCRPKIPLDTLRKLPLYFNSENSEHKLAPSYEFTKVKERKEEHVEIFQDLQKCVSAGLVVPVGEEHMYFAAIHGKACKLTHLGKYYYRMAKENQI